MTEQHLAIYGAGGFAREVAWLAKSAATSQHVRCHIDDGSAAGGSISGIPVLNWEDFRRMERDIQVVIAVADCKARAQLASRVSAAGYRSGVLVHRSVEISEHVSIGEGSIICCGSILTVDISLGAHVHINLDCTVGHDVVIEDFVTVSPGVHISGNVRIERFSYIGTGATIINGTPGAPLVIGEGAVIGAGACVTRAVEPNTLNVGVPAVSKKKLV